MFHNDSQNKCCFPRTRWIENNFFLVIINVLLPTNGAFSRFYPHKYSRRDSANTPVISCAKLQANKLKRVNARNYRWQHFEMSGSSFRTERSAPRARHTSRLSSMAVVKWDRCWGLEGPQWDIENDGLAAERGTIKGGDARGQGSPFTTPDLPWNLFSFIRNERKEVPSVAPNTNLHLRSERGFPTCLERESPQRRGSERMGETERSRVGFKHLRGAWAE